jgi:UDP-GlcNAc:undecaprenyl-phosphate GlcNAc-1-phosphate transferase
MELVVIRLLFACFIAFLVTMYLVPICSRIARTLGVLDVPDGKIKRHDQPVPYLGGVAVYLGFLASLALTLSFYSQLVLFLIGATILLFVGLIDDLIMLKPYQKLGGQLIAAYCFIRSGFFLKESFFLHKPWSIPLSVLWILTVVNAMNLVDIMDGLSSTITLCATLSFLVLALLLGQYAVAILLASFLGAVAAFFWYNKPPAKIYLGDAGSLFLGGVLATIPFLLPWSSVSIYGLLTPVIVLALPLAEVVMLVCIRTTKGIPFYQGSPDHFAIYLRANGWSKKQVLWYVCAVSIGLFVLSLAVLFNRIGLLQAVLFSGLLLIQWFFFILYDFNKKRIRLFSIKSV